MQLVVRHSPGVHRAQVHPVIPALARWRREDQKPESVFFYIVDTRPA